MIASRLPDPSTAPALRWGIVGTGWIAERFAASLTRHTGQVLAAVGSRDPERAREFAARHGIPIHGGYQDAVGSPVDVIYIATGHREHREHALLAIRAGKHLLVEKPLATNARDAEEIAAAARAAGVFCAEALWSFFLPRFDIVAQLLASPEFGRLQAVIAHNDEFLPENHRARRPELAGGSLLDLGTYPLALAARHLGEVDALSAVGTTASTGVNAQAAIGLRSGDVIASLHTGLTGTGDTSATLVGSSGAIVLPGRFYQPGPVCWVDSDGSSRIVFDEARSAHDDLFWEAVAVARDVSSDRTESAVRPLDDSIRFLRIMDAVRHELGVEFPDDHEESRSTA